MAIHPLQGHKGGTGATEVSPGGRTASTARAPASPASFSGSR